MAHGLTAMRAGDAALTVDADDGARITSLRVGDHELLVPHDGIGPGWTYGSFVMAPWAGRIRDGIASWNGLTGQYPRQPDDGHGLHGLVHSAAWSQVSPTRWALDVPGLGDGGWLAPIHLEQLLALHPDRLELSLEVTAPAPVPVTVGWHPWFHRRLGGAAVELDLPAGYLRERDATGIATDRRVPVPPPPWDDAFGGRTGPITLTWPGVLRLELEHDGPVTVVFTGKDHAVCVEPQTGPPDEVNTRPRIVAPDRPLRLTSTWRWTRLGTSP